MSKFDDDDYKFPHEEKEAKASSEEEFEVEIEDDTPVADRGRKPSATPPEDPTDDELSSYDEKVQSRIKKFTKGYHDERRAKEEALRERQAAEDFARNMYEENQKLQERLAVGSKAFIEKSKVTAASNLNMAENKYRVAFESGDTEALISAQKEMARATNEVDATNRMQPISVEASAPPRAQQEQQVQQQPANKLTPQTQEWVAENSDWFGKDEEMTSAAMGLDRKLQREYGPDYIGTDEYFQNINKTMRKRFPEFFGSDKPAEEDETPSRAKKSTTVVAPATRSTPPNRIKLKASEAAIARRLGVPIELYAKQKAAQIRNGD